MAKKKFTSELRLDAVSKDWIVIATGRAKKPHMFRTDKRVTLDASKRSCPFDTLKGQESPTEAFFQGNRIILSKSGRVPKRWTTISIPNKYPAFQPKKSVRTRLIGPYSVMDGVGFHEVIITKDHNKDIPQLSQSSVRELIDMYQLRYLELMDIEFVNHISIFKNKGFKAGASIYHPHSQLIANPMLDPDLRRSLKGSEEYYKENKKCVHCVMLDWDRKENKRILFENEHFTLVCPFAPRVAFEMRIFPKKHQAYFERINDIEKDSFAEALKVALSKLKKGLKDPDYNYFIHTSPADGGNHNHYHWHLEILPRMGTWAGFELGTGIEISTIEPEKAAAFLKKQ